MKKHPHQRKLNTVSFAYPANLMKDVIKGLKEEGYDVREDGSQRNIDGHAIEAYLEGEQMMFAMIHSNQETYILSAIDGLFTPENEEAN